MARHPGRGDRPRPKTYARWLRLAWITANGVDGPILLEDFRDIADNLISDGRMPDHARWVDAFRERTEDAIQAAQFDCI